VLVKLYILGPDSQNILKNKMPPNWSYIFSYDLDIFFFKIIINGFLIVRITSNINLKCFMNLLGCFKLIVVIKHHNITLYLHTVSVLCILLLLGVCKSTL